MQVVLNFVTKNKKKKNNNNQMWLIWYISLKKIRYCFYLIGIEGVTTVAVKTIKENATEVEKKDLLSELEVSLEVFLSYYQYNILNSFNAFS